MKMKPDDLSDEVPIPVSLIGFANWYRLPKEDVQMLARICYQGHQPKTVSDWQFIYEAIKRTIESNITQ